MRVQHNIPAMNAYRNYNNNSSGINKNLEKLSSGYKINRAGDDAAGLAISEKMRAQITGLETAQKNAKDGISLVQTAEGALTEVHDMLNRMYKLAEQSSNGTYDEGLDREQLQKEVKKLREEIDRIGNTTNFNGIKLFAASGLSATTNGDSSDTTALTLGSFVTDSEFDGMSDLNDVFAAYAEENNGDNPTMTITITEDEESGERSYSVALNGLDGYSADVVTDEDTGEISVQLTQDAEEEDGEATLVGSWSLTDSGDGTGDQIFDLSSGGGSGSAGVNGATYAGAPTSPTARGNQYTAIELSGTGIDLWVGDSADQNNILNIGLTAMNSTVLALDKIDIATQQGALDSLSYIKDAIDYISDMRGELGATQNRLEHTINNLSVMQENVQDAESTIRDTDVAEEMMKYTKNSILVQSAQAMLAQANQLPQGVLQLLQ